MITVGWLGLHRFKGKLGQGSWVPVLGSGKQTSSPDYRDLEQPREGTLSMALSVKKPKALVTQQNEVDLHSDSSHCLLTDSTGTKQI